jgi:hypothetical protein
METVVVVSDDLWVAILNLQGQPLQTIGRGKTGRGKPFTVLRGTANDVIVQPSRGEQRMIHRVLFDYALALGTPVEQLRPIMLALAGMAAVNSSYVVGILRELHRRGAL